VARNTGFAGIEDIDPTDKKAKEIVKGADLTTKSKNKGGRKPKEFKADKVLRVYLTTEQKETVVRYCAKTSNSESTLIKQLLIKEGIL
jgi:hypothetical protein